MHRIVTFRQGRQSRSCLPAFFHSLVFMACSVSSLSLLLDHSHLSVLNWSKRFGLSLHVFLIDSSATLIISSFFLARSLSPSHPFLPVVICCHLHWLSLSHLLWCSLFFTSLSYLSLYPPFILTMKKIFEQRKRVGVRNHCLWGDFFSFNNHTGYEGRGVIFGRGKRHLLKLYCVFFN